MWQLSIRLSAPPAAFFQELRHFLDRRGADTYLVEHRNVLHLATPEQATAQATAVWTLNNARVQTLSLEHTPDEHELRRPGHRGAVG